MGTILNTAKAATIAQRHLEEEKQSTIKFSIITENGQEFIAVADLEKLSEFKMKACEVIGMHKAVLGQLKKDSPQRGKYESYILHNENTIEAIEKYEQLIEQNRQLNSINVDIGNR